MSSTTAHDVHPYMCERCLTEVPMTRREFYAASGRNGSFLCDPCREKKLADKALKKGRDAASTNGRGDSGATLP